MQVSQSLDNDTLYDFAKQYRTEGLNAIPCSSEKRPVGTWTEFQNRFLTQDEFRGKLNGHAYGLGILCGAGSGGLEVIDIDNKYDLAGNLVTDYFKMICDHNEALFNRLRIIKTPSHGYHLYYRCETISGNEKLANRPTTDEERKETYEKRYKASIEKGLSEEEAKAKAKKAHDDDNARVLIETRGTGGFIVAPPTSGYSVWQNNKIVEISAEERDFLLCAARSFNEYYEVQTQRPLKQFTGESPFELTPWDHYNEEGDVIKLLEDHEWIIDYKKGDRVFFTRPGKSKGCSADYNSHLRLFKCWSTSVGGFQSEKAYNHTSVFAILECNNDYAKASEELEARGFGKRKPVEEKGTLKQGILTSGKGASETLPHSPSKTFADFDHLLITTEKVIPKEEPVITICGASFAAAHNISLISAAPKGAKTAINNVMVSCSISDDGSADGFPDIKAAANIERKAVLLFDTEQSAADQQYNVRTIVKRAGLDSTPDFLRCYNIRPLDFREYKEATEAICKGSAEKFSGIHSIYIDGGADYIASVNDEEQSTEIIQWFTHLSIKFDCPVIIVVHQNPGTTKERGHFGSTGQRKCYGLIEIVKEGEAFTLQPKMLRRSGNAEMQMVQFSFYQPKGYHIQVDAPDKEVSKRLKAREKVVEAMVEVFPTSSSMRYSEIMKALMELSGVAKKTAHNWLMDMVDLEYVIKREDGNYHLDLDLDKAKGVKGVKDLNLTPITLDSVKSVIECNSM